MKLHNEIMKIGRSAQLNNSDDMIEKVIVIITLCSAEIDKARHLAAFRSAAARDSILKNAIVKVGKSWKKAAEQLTAEEITLIAPDLWDYYAGQLLTPHECDLIGIEFEKELKINL